MKFTRLHFVFSKRSLLRIACFNRYPRNQLKPWRNMEGSDALIESATVKHLTTHFGGREGNGSKGGGMAEAG